MKGDIRKALDYLNENKVRATYTAVQSYLGFGVMEKLDWEEILGPRRQYTSWVVSKKSSMPIGYAETDLHPDLLVNEKVITKGRQLQTALKGYTKSAEVESPNDKNGQDEEAKVEVADCHGNNCAVMCPKCGKAYLVSSFLNKGVRSCPHCGGSKAVFKEVKEEWEATHQDAIVAPEQEATRLIFKREWLGYDVWVTFTEGDVTYRYPHDQLLQTFISRLGIIAGTKSWETDGMYHFPRLSGEQKILLQRYVVDDQTKSGVKVEMVNELPSNANTERE
ncbi:MAG: hypothetical protein K9M45_07915 [Kiritimatiellales bacterium]|nr:hypothetical protein [Kiritimatiellales bacterium]